MANKVYKIGTRDSQLAVWQAEEIQKQLSAIGIQSELVFIKSLGELDLVSPLYEMGVQGIFTKTLDIALLNGQIDIAVHSLKDVPTQLPQGIVMAAIPVRGNHKDVLVTRKSDDLPSENSTYLLATSSLRRKAQWLHRYPLHKTESLRGNINTRLSKLIENQEWNGVLFAAAGIERINLQVPFKMELDWMLPAPGQGALAVVCRNSDSEIIEACALLDHGPTRICTQAERMFLRALMGGCTMPIAAYAFIKNNQLHFKGNICTIDGSRLIEVEKIVESSSFHKVGQLAAQEILALGGQEIIDTFKIND
jgi:hydroxymethylbilane synthase